MSTVPDHIDVNSAIVERCKNGERKAFQELYSLYAKAMLNISARILNNTEEAQEVLQDSFLKAFNNIASYDNTYAFGAWLRRIVINGSLDVLKKRKMDLVEMGNNDFPDEMQDEEEDIVYDVEIIKQCIKKLPDGYRTVLTLYLFEELSHKEIASLLNISEGTSKSQYNRARKKLIELVKQNTVIHGR